MSYTTNKVLLTTKQVQLIDPMEFVIAALDVDSKTFVVHVAIWKQEEMPVHLKKRAQILDKAQVGVLLFDKAPTEVPTEYSDDSNVFSVKNVAKLPKNTRMNEYAIKLEKRKLPLFGPIYSLGPVELETLKTYIKTNLANSFIWPLKSLASAYILFDWKSNRSFYFFVDYWGLNNITIKN